MIKETSSESRKTPLSNRLQPIQLIRFDQKKNIHLTPQATSLFSTIQTTSQQLCIVCVAGKYRTGKSYILNRVLLQQSHGFEVGPTINACTKGLWMWPEIVKIQVQGRVKQCILIDTEGLGSLQEGENTDLKIFLMAMLLSSYLIYNSVGSIDEKALQSLNLVVNMAQLLQKSGDRFDSQQLINSFPSFMWLVRDFSLRLQDENGQAITSQQYLQNALKTQKGKSAAAQRKNQIRKQLKTFFHQRDCFTLIRPTSNQKDLQNLSTLQQNKLRPQFVSLIKQLRSRIHSSIQPKRIRGRSITPQGFIELCNYYITSINSGKLPSINSNWDNLCISESGRVVKKFEIRLKEYVDGQEGNEKSEYGLKEIGEKLLEEASESVDRSFLGKLEKRLLKERLKEILNAKIVEAFQMQFKNEEELIEKQLKSLFSEEFSQQQDSNHPNYNPFHKLDSLGHLFSEFTRIMSKHSSSKSFQFMKQKYEKLFQYIQEKFVGLMEEDISSVREENELMKMKLKRMEQEELKDKQEEKRKVTFMRQEAEQAYRKVRKWQSTNQKNLKEIQTLKQRNNILQNEIQTLTQKIHQNEERHAQSLTFQQSHLTTSFTHKIHLLQTSLQQSHLTNQSLTQELKQLQIRQRKLNRQCEIYKQKYLEKQKESEESIKEVEELKGEIDRLEKEKRKVIRKATGSNSSLFSSSMKFDRGALSLSMASFKEAMQEQQNLQSSRKNSFNQIDLANKTFASSYKDSPFNQSFQFSPTQDDVQIEQFLTKINQLKIENSKLQQQSKNLTKLYTEQKTINSLLIHTPQSINYQSLKKNFQLEIQNGQKLKEKTRQLEVALSYVGKVECLACGEMVSKASMVSGGDHCHWTKCVSGKGKEVDFDVSYVYNADGELNFLFQVKVQNQDKNDDFDQDDTLVRLGLSSPPQENSNRQMKWQVTKSLKLIRVLLTKLSKPQKDITLFADSQVSTPSSQTSSEQEQTLNLNEKRRLFLDELCHQLKQQVWKRKDLLEFFGMDLHLMREKRRKNKGQNILKLNKNQAFTKKKKKIGVLNLDLGEIIEEEHNDNLTPLKQSNGNRSNRSLAQSMNMMKTTKFALKKVFKFGPNV